MDRRLFESMDNFFTNYVIGFYSDDEEINFNLKLKEEHTKRVCSNIISIGKDLGLDESDRALANTIALFHDIGRFEQFTKYRTFSDVRSENHSELGIKVLNETHILNKLTNYERDVVIMSIRNHNALSLPEMEDLKALTFARLIRDADKLDILGILSDFYQNPQNYEHLKVGESAKIYGVSGNVLESIMNFQNIKYSDVKSSDDMKLLRLSWIYDINYKYTLVKVREKGYLEAIINSMPKTDEILKVYELLKGYIAQKTAGE
ncbi:MAG TPA: HD domain-containing protein [Pseudobacteroides sp.]|uniref:HD domain-containing protein n=1 Tax=Pseudobacteroides sp. TaxID=1968840 RepID=UPI002F95B519